MDLAPGTLVRDNLRLLRPLGEGGMGRVWVAEHLTLKSQVAVKFILETLVSENPELVDRFNREARTSAQIKSHHVVQVFDHGVMDDGTPFIVMELLEGESLGERLERVEVLPLDQMAIVLRQAARALDKAHKLGIVHRDIKPDNIFLVTSEEELLVKVLDFGIAKPTRQAPKKRLTQPGALIGTPEFMSREQVLLGKDDPRSDLWALAVVTYLALTGDIPFDGPTVVAICAAIEQGRFAPPSELRPELPPELDRWFARALHPDPTQRFPSAKEMAVAFLRLVPAGAGVDVDSWEDTGQYASRDLAAASGAEDSQPGAAPLSEQSEPSPVGQDDAPGPTSGGTAAVPASPWQTSSGQLRRQARERYGATVVPESEPPAGLDAERPGGSRWRRSPLLVGGFAVIVVGAAIGFGVAWCEADGGEGCASDADCAADHVCVFVEDHAECRRKCGASDDCPMGRTCDRCARSGSCPHCNICVPACL